ncbi:SMC-Scp complex subunit ScpB [Limibacter armeniacum]|uniref:SMC-Scp complex subunit ScpB n=1 Tax=Limibacter armeniacum TaxID=466084 RepID=UPI002FE5EB2E
MTVLDKHAEAIVFCAPTPVTADEITTALQESLGTSITKQEVEAAMARLQEKYQDDTFAFEIINSGGGYKFLTKHECSDSTGAFLKHRSKRKLSKSSLETLSIIAYRQPISRTELEQIRGVGCDYAVKKLLEKELVEIKGKSDAIGRPLLYGTTKKFLEYFGINNVSDLPNPKEFKEEENEIGEEMTA